MCARIGVDPLACMSNFKKMSLSDDKYDFTKLQSYYQKLSSLTHQMTRYCQVTHDNSVWLIVTSSTPQWLAGQVRFLPLSWVPFPTVLPEKNRWRSVGSFSQTAVSNQAYVQSCFAWFLHQHDKSSGSQVTSVSSHTKSLSLISQRAKVFGQSYLVWGIFTMRQVKTLNIHCMFCFSVKMETYMICVN